MTTIKKAAVIGAGVMGKGIAAHLASCGIEVLLLDLDGAFVQKALADLPKAKPALCYDVADLRRIRGGTIDADLPKIADCDWVIEVIIEQLAPKQALYAKIEQHMKPGQIISSNTSGISWTLLTDGRSDAFKQQFCITHFFNPVRYLKLVELVGGAGTSPAVLQTMHTVLTDVLGKGVVRAKDTPNFVANRIGVHGMMVAMHALIKNNWRAEVVDKVMGPPVARPKSASFRTADIVGLDTLAHVAKTTVDACPHDETRDLHQPPAYLLQMLEQKMLGDKTGQGFYKKSKAADGSKEILALNVQTLQYEPQQKIKTASLGKAKDIEDAAERVAAVVWADDEAGQIAWQLASATLVYAANRIPEIADDIINVDHAMEWGFGWEIGPFEQWDALGVAKVAERLTQEGRAIPTIVTQVLEKGGGKFYNRDVTPPTYFDIAKQAHLPIPQPAGLVVLAQRKKNEKVIVARNDSASLVDLGDGVLCCEFHSKMNAIDGEIIAMVNEGIDRAEQNGTGLVIGNEGKNFCVGANLMLIYLEAQQSNWDVIDGIVRQFQGMVQRIRFAKKPVVVAPFGMTFGGGCEFILAANHARGAAELYTGLVELGVGLIPAGGGCKNMILRGMDMARASKNPADKIWMAPDDGGPFPKVRRAFETIAYAKVSTSAKDAQGIGYLRSTDAITLDRELLLTHAKADVLRLAPTYQPPVMEEKITLPGAGGYYALLDAVDKARLQGLVTEYDQVLAAKLAFVLTGGGKPNLHLATEQDILDAEREAFLSLCGEERSQARIQSMLMSGKPLRN